MYDHLYLTICAETGVLGMVNKYLYQRVDIVGTFLSNWRNNVAIKNIHGDLIDLACGDNILVKNYGGGIGIDIVDYGSVDLVCKDFRRLPLAEACCDTVTIIASLNYFSEPEKVLCEVNRILRDDGILILTMSNIKIMKIWHKFRDKHVITPAFSSEHIMNLLKIAGFVVQMKKHFMLWINTIYVVKKRK